MKQMYYLAGLLLVGIVSCLTDEELAAFKPVDPDHVDVNTGKKSEVSLSRDQWCIFACG